MPPRNRTQAFFPSGSTPLLNPVGTAPGIWMELPRNVAAQEADLSRPGVCLIAAMPGVPSEMHRMFHEQVRPRLPGGGNIIRRARINCFGLGESHTEELLGELTARGRDPEIGITAHEATITLRILAHGRSESECAAKIAAAQAEIRRRLGHYVFGEEDDEVEHALLRSLREQGATLATAESGTGGFLAQTLAAVAGFESLYLGGLVLPTSAARRSMLGVDDADHPVSADSVRAMAAATRERFQSDFALAVSQYPVLDPNALMSSAPTAYLALADRETVESHPINLGGNPAILRSRTAKSAMNLLRLRLLQHGPAADRS
jgi:nicotinamide-nucleotide amidase